MHCIFCVASICCSTVVFALLLTPVAALVHLPCCFHLQQHHFNLICSFHLLQLRCINSANSSCRCTTKSALLPSLSLAAPPPLQQHPWCFHLLQRHYVISSNSACYNFILLSMLHPPAAAPCTAIPLLLPPKRCNATAYALLVALAAAPLHLPCCCYLLQHYCICVAASIYCSTIVPAMLLPPVATQLHLLCCLRLLQHHCICYVAPTCCSTTAASLLPPSTTASLDLLCCFHLLQEHHCICTLGASTCCNGTSHLF
jgi:hypothetical protein